MKRITDPDFKYTKADDTDLRKTFARIRKEQAQRAAEAAGKVTPIAAAPARPKEAK